MQLVSVIITTYQRQEFLINAINSVYKSDYSHFEIIVVDDNGKGTEYQLNNKVLLDKYTVYSNFKYFAMPNNSGACKARNQGAAIANGEILMFLDDDDYYFPNKISAQVNAITLNNVDACLCAMKRLDSNNCEIISNQNFPRGQNLKQFITNGNCFTTMIAITKAAFDKIDGFSEIARFQDEFFMCKFFENNLQVFLLQEQLFVFNEHDNNRISLGNIRNVSSAYEQLYEFKKKHFELFSKQEQLVFTNNHYLNQANIRISGSVKERVFGLMLLMKSNLFFKNWKIFLKLIFPSRIINLLK